MLPRLAITFAAVLALAAPQAAGAAQGGAALAEARAALGVRADGHHAFGFRGDQGRVDRAVLALSRAYDRMSASQRAAARKLLARPTDGAADTNAFITYSEPSTFWDTPGGHFRVHYIANPASVDAPLPDDLVDAAGTPVPDGVPDWVQTVGNTAEFAHDFEVVQRAYRPITNDTFDGNLRGGDGRFDIYVVDFAGHGKRGVLGLVANDPIGSLASYMLVDDDYSVAEIGPVSKTLEVLQATVAHELFHAVQFSYTSEGLPVWLAESTATWMESQVYPDVHDNVGYLAALVGKATETALWKTGNLHEYGAWWFINFISDASVRGANWPRRVLDQAVADEAAGRSNDRDVGVGLLSRSSGGMTKLSEIFRNYSIVNSLVFDKALKSHKITTLSRGQHRWSKIGDIEPLQVHYWKFNVRSREVVINIQAARSGKTFRPGDAALILGGIKGNVVVKLRKLEPGLWYIRGTIPKGRPKTAILVVTHVDPTVVNYRVGAEAR